MAPNTDVGVSHKSALEIRLESTNSQAEEDALAAEVGKQLAEASTAKETPEEEILELEVPPASTPEKTATGTKDSPPADEAAAKLKALEEENALLKKANEKSAAAKKFAWDKMGAQSQELGELRKRVGGQREADDDDPDPQPVRQPAPTAEDPAEVEARWNDYLSSNTQYLAHEEALLDLARERLKDPNGEAAASFRFLPGTMILDVGSTVINLDRLRRERLTEATKAEASKISSQTKELQDAAIKAGGGVPRAARVAPKPNVPTEAEMMANPEKYYPLLTKAMASHGLVDSDDPPKG